MSNNTNVIELVKLADGEWIWKLISTRKPRTVLATSWIRYSRAAGARRGAQRFLANMASDRYEFDLVTTSATKHSKAGVVWRLRSLGKATSNAPTMARGDETFATAAEARRSFAKVKRAAATSPAIVLA